MGQPKSNNNQNSLKNVAIIMDGNGRWAKNNKLKITKGHEKGVGVVKDMQSSGEISEDDMRRSEDLIQKQTDSYISVVDSELKNKESDLLEI